MDHLHRQKVVLKNSVEHSNTLDSLVSVLNKHKIDSNKHYLLAESDLFSDASLLIHPSGEYLPFGLDLLEVILPTMIEHRIPFFKIHLGSIMNQENFPYKDRTQESFSNMHEKIESMLAKNVFYLNSNHQKYKPTVFLEQIQKGTDINSQKLFFEHTQNLQAYQFQPSTFTAKKTKIYAYKKGNTLVIYEAVRFPWQKNSVNNRLIVGSTSRTNNIHEGQLENHIISDLVLSFTAENVLAKTNPITYRVQ